MRTATGARQMVAACDLLDIRRTTRASLHVVLFAPLIKQSLPEFVGLRTLDAIVLHFVTGWTNEYEAARALQDPPRRIAIDLRAVGCRAVVKLLRPHLDIREEARFGESDELLFPE